MKKFLLAVLLLSGGLTAASAATLFVATAYANLHVPPAPDLSSLTIRAGESEDGAAEPGPVSEICLPADPSEPTVCAAFFLDETGYTICVSDELVGDSYCRTSPYSSGPDLPDLHNGFPDAREIIPGNGVTQAVEA